MERIVDSLRELSLSISQVSPDPIAQQKILDLLPRALTDLALTLSQLHTQSQTQIITLQQQIIQSSHPLQPPSSCCANSSPPLAFNVEGLDLSQARQALLSKKYLTKSQRELKRSINVRLGYTAKTGNPNQRVAAEDARLFWTEYCRIKHVQPNKIPIFWNLYHRWMAPDSCVLDYCDDRSQALEAFDNMLTFMSKYSALRTINLRDYYVAVREVEDLLDLSHRKFDNPNAHPHIKPLKYESKDLKISYALGPEKRFAPPSPPAYDPRKDGPVSPTEANPENRYKPRNPDGVRSSNNSSDTDNWCNHYLYRDDPFGDVVFPNSNPLVEFSDDITPKDSDLPRSTRRRITSYGPRNKTSVPPSLKTPFQSGSRLTPLQQVLSACDPH